MEINLIKERSKIYKSIKDNNLQYFDSDILIKFKIEKQIQKRIENNVRDIIYDSLYYFYGKKFKFRKNFLDIYSDFIFKLPNLTPNGILKPKKEILKHFNQLHKNYIQLLKNKGLLNLIKKSRPINVRLKKGNNSSFIKKRPYSTFKIHSDAWNGLSVDCIFMHHVFGSPKNTIEYFKPKKPKKKILRVIKDYNLGKKEFISYEKLGKLKKGEIALVDLLCLHKTSIETMKNRVSCDFPILFNTKAKRYLYNSKSKNYYYLNNSNFKNFNYKKILEFNKSIFSSFK